MVEIFFLLSCSKIFVFNKLAAFCFCCRKKILHYTEPNAPGFSDLNVSVAENSSVRADSWYNSHFPTIFIREAEGSRFSQSSREIEMAFDGGFGTNISSSP